MALTAVGIRRWIPLALFVGAGVTACETDQRGRLVVGAPVWEAGEVLLGARAETRIALRNTGAAPIEVEVRRAGGVDPAFEALVLSRRLEAGAETALEVTFSPEGPGAVGGRFELLTGTTGELPAVVDVSGVGVENDLEVSPPAIDFGRVAVATSTTEAVTLRNSLGRPLLVALSGSVEPCWRSDRPLCLEGDAFDGSDALELPPEGFVRFSMRLRSAERPGRESGALALETCAQPACRIEVPISADRISTGLACQPSRVEFAPVAIGTTRTATVTCDNVGRAPIERLRFALDGPSPPFFLAPATDSTLRPGEGRRIEVRFSPETYGSFSGTLRVEGRESGRTPSQVVTLGGVAGGGQARLEPEAGLDFGLVSLLVPARRRAMLSNTGFRTLRILSATIVGPDALAFDAPGARAGLLQLGGTWALDVEFHPRRPGPHSARLQLETDEPGRPWVELPLRGEGLDLPSCDYALSATELRFGVVMPGRERRLGLIVENRGESSCLVRAHGLSDAAFTLGFGGASGDRSTQTLGPGESLSLELGFAPVQATPHEGQLELHLSSATTPEPSIRLVGEGRAAPGLLVAPGEIDFGPRDPGCGAVRPVRLHNRSGSPVVVRDAQVRGLEGGPFSVRGLGGGAVIPPGGLFGLEVLFDRPSLGPHAGLLELTVEEEGRAASYVVGLFGEGREDGEAVERFAPPGPREAVDVLFVVGKSNDLVLAALRESLGALFAGLSTSAPSAHIGVTTTDLRDEEGRMLPRDAFRGEIVTVTSTDAAVATLEALLDLPPGTGAAANQSGFAAVEAALSARWRLAHNSGFLRPGAPLSVLFLTDARERSEDAFRTYLDAFLDMKGARKPNALTVASVVGNAPGGCVGPFGRAEPAPRYVEMARLTGGLYRSICEPLDQALSAVAETLFGARDVFFLPGDPDPDTVEVLGSAAPEAWTYDRGRSAVVLSQAARPGQAVEIRYRNRCERP